MRRQIEDVYTRMSAARNNLSVSIKFGDADAGMRCMLTLDRQSQTVAEGSAVLNLLIQAAENAAAEYQSCENEAAQLRGSSETEEACARETAADEDGADREYEDLVEQLKIILPRPSTGLILMPRIFHRIIWKPIFVIYIVRPEFFYPVKRVDTVISGLATTLLKR
ncbi:MAG: hypothetical protein LUF32_05355 [Clostridiales bacterium]|nr:hypothetical protein [Clostridiales bacterium]